MLVPNERGLLLVYCKDHSVAVCPQCSESVAFDRIGADLIMGRRDFCPSCRADLTTALRQHLAHCTLLRVQEREACPRSPQMRQQAPNGASSSGVGSRVMPGKQGDVAAAGDRGGPRAMPERPEIPDDTREALQESWLLREKAEAAIDQARRVGTGYLR
jgi:hypothetical protein